MKKIRVLVTGGGSPGIIGTIKSLRSNYDNREIYIVCTDMREDCIGKFYADSFYSIPPAKDEEKYLEKIFEISKKEKIDVILPQNTAELNLLSRKKDYFRDINVSVVVSEFDSMILANNKYELLKICKKLNIPYPDFFIVDNKKDLLEAAKKLGWPEKPLVVKLPCSNGSRGLRIIDEKLDYSKLFFNEKPTNIFTKMYSFLEILSDHFQPLIAMEYLPGEEITIDLFRDENTFISIPRVREEIRSGISFKNKAYKNELLINYSRLLANYLDLKYCFGFQFKFSKEGIPKILECNPRVQGTMIFSTFMGANLIYSSIKSVMNEAIPSFELNWETRLIRYWGAVSINKDVMLDEL